MENNTKYGIIELDDKIFKKLIYEALKECDDKVLLHDKKGNILISSEEGLKISFEVDIKFGESISEETKKILDYLQEVLQPAFPDIKTNIKILVKGMITHYKGNIIRRNIVIDREF